MVSHNFIENTQKMNPFNLNLNKILDDNPSWQGSLRHVKPTPKKNRKNDDDDIYGSAPWMGTLRSNFRI